MIRIPCSSFLRSFPWPGVARASQVLNASLHAYHALCGPRQTLKNLTSHGPFVLASGTLTPSPSALNAFSGLYQAFGIAVSPAVYVVPCVRFNCVVRLYIFTSFTVATLDMSGWLDLAQQGLSPCKKRQASLGALAYSVLSLKPGSNQASEKSSKERRGDKTCWTKPRSRTDVAAMGI